MFKFAPKEAASNDDGHDADRRRGSNADEEEEEELLPHGDGVEQYAVEAGHGHSLQIG